MSPKKSFKNSPAMQFLSIQGEDDTQKVTPATKEINTAEAPAQETPTPQEPQNTFSPQIITDTKEKDLPKAVLSPPAKQAEAPPPPIKRNPEYIETRSKRVQLLMQPSLHGTLRTLAQQQNISVNDLIHQVMEAHVQTKPTK